jgi:c-di-GMP-binding flagellar brake protein YcgR
MQKNSTPFGRSDKDKRQFPRFKSYRVIRAIGPHGREIQKDDSALINMSEGGMLFYSVEEVKADTHIEMHVEIPEFHSSIRIAAVVSWVQRATERPGEYFVGVQFEELPAPHRSMIQKLVPAPGSPTPKA